MPEQKVGCFEMMRVEMKFMNVETCGHAVLSVLAAGTGKHSHRLPGHWAAAVGGANIIVSK